MSQDTQVVLMVAAFVVPFALFIFWILRFKARRRAAYETFAARHGLEYHHSAWPMLTGSVDGRDFYMGLDQMRTAGGRAKGGATRAAAMLVAGIELKDVPEGLVVVRRGLIEKAMKSDVVTNDPEFDKKCLVKCSNPDAAMAYLTAERRAKLIELTSKKLALQNGELSYGPGSGKLSKLEHLEQFSQRFFDAAPVLDGDAAGSAGARRSARANASTPAAEHAGPAQGSSTPGTVSGPNPGLAGLWMAGTVLILVYLGSWLSGYFTVWFSVPLLVRLVIAAGVGFFAASVLDLREPAVGAAVGVVAWLFSGIVASVFYWSVGGELSGWFSTMGIFRIVVAAASGAGMVLFLRRKAEGMAL